MTTSLHDYASRGKLQKIIDKVGLGRDLNRQEPSYGNTVLGMAAACGHAEVVEWLVGNGAKLDVQEVHGWTALHLAALKGHAPCARLLVNAGADRTIKDKEGQLARDLAVNPPEWAPADEEAKAGRQLIADMLK